MSFQYQVCVRSFCMGRKATIHISLDIFDSSTKVFKKYTTTRYQYFIIFLLLQTTVKTYKKFYPWTYIKHMIWIHVIIKNAFFFSFYIKKFTLFIYVHTNKSFTDPSMIMHFNRINFLLSKKFI